MPEPEPLPSVVASIDQFLTLVGEARGHRDPARWLENRLLEMRHAIVTLETAMALPAGSARGKPGTGGRRLSDDGFTGLTNDTKAGLRHGDLHRGEG